MKIMFASDIHGDHACALATIEKYDVTSQIYKYHNELELTYNEFETVYKDMTNTTLTSAGVITSSFGTAFGGKATIVAAGLNKSDDNAAFTITYEGLSKDACVAMLTGDWGSQEGSGLVDVQANKDTGLLGGEGTKRLYTLTTATSACNAENNGNTIQWKYF